MPHAQYQISNQARDAETDSVLAPAPPPHPPPFLSQGPWDSPSTLYGGLTGIGQSLIDSLLMLLFLPHTPHRALVWVSVIAPVVVHCRLLSTIHTNHNAVEKPIFILFL